MLSVELLCEHIAEKPRINAEHRSTKDLTECRQHMPHRTLSIQSLPMNVLKSFTRPLARSKFHAFAISPCLTVRQNHAATSPHPQPGALHGVKILDLTRVLAVSRHVVVESNLTQ